MEKPETSKKMKAGIAAIIVLSVCLCVTTFALFYPAAVEDNLFGMGAVKVDLNGGRPVIQENEFLFEPGATVEKNFYIENKSTCDVYYKLYFDNVDGGLAAVLDVQIRDGETVLYSGKATELTKANAGAAEDILRTGERRTLTIMFHFPKDSGNMTQGRRLSFDLNADAVQTRNNPGRIFE